MKGAEFRAIRRALLTRSGRPVSQSKLGKVMGYGSSAQCRISDIERGEKVPARTERLLLAYAADYRPDDWPS